MKMARVKEDYRLPTVTAFGGREYTKKDWQQIPAHEEVAMPSHEAMLEYEDAEVVEKAAKKAPAKTKAAPPKKKAAKDEAAKDEAPVEEEPSEEPEGEAPVEAAEEAEGEPETEPEA